MEFHIAVGRRDWDDVRGGWRSGALLLPGAKVVAIHAGGREASRDDYAHAGDLVRWIPRPVPDEASIAIQLEKTLEPEERRLDVEREKLALEREKVRGEQRLKMLGTAGAAISFLLTLFVAPQIPALRFFNRGGASGVVADAAYKQAANALELRLDETRGKGTSPDLLPDAAYRRLKRATFQSMNELNASPEILWEALRRLEGRKPEFKAVADRVVAEFPQLVRLRHEWLRDEAIPALRRSRDALRSSPIQTAASASVPLPEELDVVRGQRGQETVSNLDAVERELQLVQERLDSAGGARSEAAARR
jgi:hypothetical protein